MLKDVLEKELQELELDANAEIEGLEEELAGCGSGSTSSSGTCSGSCGTNLSPIAKE